MHITLNDYDKFVSTLKEKIRTCKREEYEHFIENVLHDKRFLICDVMEIHAMYLETHEW